MADVRFKQNSKQGLPNVWANFGYNIIYQLLIILIPIITTPYIARVFGADGVGEYSYAYSIANYFILFEMLGVNNYGNRTISKVKDNKNELSRKFFEIYALQAGASIIVIIVYLFYCLFISDNSVLSIILLINVISGAIDINWFFNGLEKFRITVTKNAIIKIITTILLFVLVKKNTDIYKYALINSIGLFASQTVLWMSIRQNITPCRVRIEEVLKHIKPNFKLFVPILAISLYKIMDKIMLGFITTKAEVGYYENCDKVVQIPMAIVSALGVAMLPRVSNLVANKRTKDSNDYLEKSIHLVVMFSVPMSFGIMAVATEFVPIFYGPGYDKCVQVFYYLMPSCIFLAIANVIRTQYLIPYELDEVYLMSVFSGSILNLLVNYLLIPRLGSIGAAIGTLCAETVVCLVQLIAVSKYTDLKKYLFESLCYVLFGLVMYALVVTIQIPVSPVTLLFVKTVSGALIYLTLLIVYFLVFKKSTTSKLIVALHSKQKTK